MSDDNGCSWNAGADIAVPRTALDSPDPAVPVNFWLWTVAARDRHGRPILGYTHTTSTTVKKRPSNLWVHKDTRCKFVRFENLDEGPDPRFVADRAAIEIDEIPREDSHVAAELHVLCDRHLLLPFL